MAAPNAISNVNNNENGTHEEHNFLIDDARLYLLNTYDERNIEISAIFNILMAIFLSFAVAYEFPNPFCRDVKIWLVICVSRSILKVILTFILERRRQWFIYRKFPFFASKFSELLDIFGMVSCNIL